MRREARRGFQARAKNASAEDDEADEEKLRKELGELGPQLRRAHAKSRNLEREGAALDSELKRRQKEASAQNKGPSTRPGAVTRLTSEQ